MPLYRRPGLRSFYSRLVIPAAFRRLFEGRREIQKSLGTQNKTVASLRESAWSGQWAALFLRLHALKHTMTQDELRTLITRYIGERLEEWEESWYASPDGEKPPACETEGNDWQDYLSAFSASAVEDHAQALSVNDLSTIGPTLQDFIQRYRLERVEQDKRMTSWLSRELLKAEQRIAREMAERVRGNFDGPSPPTIHHQPAPAVPPSALQPSTPLLSVVVKDYLAHYKHRSKGTLTQKQTVLNRFIELIGDKPASSYVKKDCIKYREMLRKVPANASKRFRGVPLLEVIEQAKGLPDTDMLSKTTVNGDLTHLGHMFSWLIDHEHHAGPNPSENLQYTDVESESHEMYTDTDITRIFMSDDYKKTLREREYARYWIPLILLYTGCRREEAACLALSDLKDDDNGILYFDIAPDLARGRRLKNKSSRRVVPVHSHLIELGLMDYIKHTKDAGHTLLFPHGKTKGRLTVGDSVGKWYARLLDRLHITGKKTLHSFRPTITTKLYEAGCDGEARRKILGHSAVDIHEHVYLRPPLAPLRQHLEKVDFRPLLKGLPAYKPILKGPSSLSRINPSPC